MSVPLALGARAVFRKTVSESDVYLFAGITGDLHANHVDEATMRRSPYGGRIAHGALLVGYMSAASTRIVSHMPPDSPVMPVSLGYDRIRFLKGVRLGDTIEVRYVIDVIDAERSRSEAAIEIVNEAGEIVCAARHILKFVPA
jgi:3-hydroxybutyryl-CoA dehydratase